MLHFPIFCCFGGVLWQRLRNFIVSFTKSAPFMEEKKLFLLDAYALIYRAYYALFRAPRVTSKGLNTSAIYGFCNTLDEVLRKENPSHIAVCFDPKGGTFRHEAYAEYKAQREAQPEDITKSLPYIKAILEAYNIPVVEVPGYEADDVIGTLARKAEAEGYVTYMMTPDKDYGQLVSERVLQYRPSTKGTGFEVRGVKEICEKYGIQSPSQVIDLLALEGDKSDNIPGCPGVGEKTAVKLINEFGSVENLIENAHQIKGALQQKVSDNAEQIRFSKFLVTIKTDVPVDVEIDSLARREEDADKLMKLYSELEFKVFMNRLAAKLGKAAPEAEKTTQPVAKPQADDMWGSLFDEPAVVEEAAAVIIPTSFDGSGYRTLTDANAIKSAINNARHSLAVGLAMYARGVDAMTARLSGLAIAVSPGQAYYIVIPDEQPLRGEVIKAIAPLFASETVIISHDIKRDYIVLHNEGVVFAAPYYDTSVAHYLLQPEMKHSLSMLANTYLNYRTLDYVEEGTTARKQAEIMPADAPMRCCEMADVLLQIKPRLQLDLSKQGLSPLMEDIELPFITVLADMEIAGVRIDVGELAKMSVSLTQRLVAMEQEAYELAGSEFNVASPMQVGDILFGRLQIDPKAKRTKTGAYSTTEEILEKYRHTHPLVDLILKIRGLRKLLSTYVNALPELINPATNRIHTSYNQTVTATGRLSSSNPNLQNIPVRSDDGKEIRRAFIADEGDIFLAADYSQIELRLIADMSGDREMIDAFLSGADIHQATAAKIYKVPIDQVTADQRRNAKTANFGIIYGISAFGLSERLGISRGEAKALIEGYYATYPSMRDYMDRCVERAKRDGYVTTIKGRKRMLPGITSNNSVVRGFAERNAINAPIQGSAADVIKIAMINIAREMKERRLQSTMIMQVHDELVFTVKPHEFDVVKELVVRNMQHAYTGRVPLLVSVGTGNNWLEAH